MKAEILRRFRGRPGPNVDWNVNEFEDLAPARWENGLQVRLHATTVYAAIWQLITQGVLIPGHRTHGRMQQGNEHFNGLPYLTITPYGHEVIRNLSDDLHPADAADYLAKMKDRVPLANETVIRYVGESVATFNSGHYLASAVLIGVAAESLLDQLYEAIGDHLTTGQAEYSTKLKGKQWASQRLEYARTRLLSHLKELPDELQVRVDQYLDMLAQIIKTSRNDVGHGRPLRVDREIASMNLVSFPILAKIVYELMVELRNPCRV